MPSVLSTEEFEGWFDGLQVRAARARIQVCIDRIEDGHFGDFKPIGDRVFEARVHFGPGYRLYFTMQGQELIFLQGGTGTSSTAADVSEAIRVARLLREES